MSGDLRRIRGIADYQFGRGCGQVLFPEGVTFTHSERTGRIRHIYLNQTLLASIRPNDGLITLTIAGAERIKDLIKDLGLYVKVGDEAAEFISMGRSVFAKHVLEAGGRIRPGDEVIVVDEGGNILAVGTALLSGDEMLSFKAGVAVKVRRGRREKTFSTPQGA
ncbi:MAG: PUA domain-containing protein [Candidatus Bathyarchaeia archaeon]